MPVVTEETKPRNRPIARGLAAVVALLMLSVVIGGAIVVGQARQPIHVGPLLVIGPRSEWKAFRIAGYPSWLYLKPPFAPLNRTRFQPLLTNGTCIFKAG